MAGVCAPISMGLVGMVGGVGRGHHLNTAPSDGSDTEGVRGRGGIRLHAVLCREFVLLLTHHIEVVGLVGRGAVVRNPISPV